MTGSCDRRAERTAHSSSGRAAVNHGRSRDARARVRRNSATPSMRAPNAGGRLLESLCFRSATRAVARPVFRYDHPMDAWPRCLQRLEAELPAEDVHTWLKPLQAHAREGSFVLYAPNAFVMEEVRARYLARIRELVAHFAGDGEVSLEIGSLRKPGSPGLPPAQAFGGGAVVARPASAEAF